jgi:transmembrane 9 superfamily member 1
VLCAESHFIFSSVWGHKVYTLFGILIITFFLLTLVSGCIVVGLAFFQLASEDYHWWWRSFMSGGMVGVFVFLHAVVFYYGHSEMSGFLQGSFFFGNMALVAFAFFLMFGAIGFTAAFWFVHYIYSASKSD